MLENKQEDPMIKLVIRSDGQENRGRSSGRGKKVKKEVGWHITCGIVVAVAVMV